MLEWKKNHTLMRLVTYEILIFRNELGSNGDETKILIKLNRPVKKLVTILIIGLDRVILKCNGYLYL